MGLISSIRFGLQLDGPVIPARAADLPARIAGVPALTAADLPKLDEDALTLSKIVLSVYDGGKLSTSGDKVVRDGKLDKTELAISSFESLDANKDGAITAQELYVEFQKMPDAKRSQFVQTLEIESKQAKKVQGKIKAIAYSVIAADIATPIGLIALSFFARIGAVIYSLLSAGVPAGAHELGAWAIDKQVGKLNESRDRIAKRFDGLVSR